MWAFVMGNRGIMCSQQIWQSLTEQLRQRGEGRHESGAFLLGKNRSSLREILEVIYYDELDPHAYCTGVCILHADAFAKLWRLCREKGLTVVADVHTHPMDARQSLADRMNPMVARAGHIAIIIPDFAAVPVRHDRLGIYVYRGNHTWSNQSPSSGSTFFHSDFWS